jgi:hypothetical protein
VYFNSTLLQVKTYTFFSELGFLSLRFQVLYKITKIFMIFIMLTAQIGESFALSFMPCADDGVMVMNGKNMDHSKYSMTMDKSSVITDEDCCQKDCCCPMGLMTVDVPSEPNIDTPIDYKTTLLIVSHSTIHNIFLALPQRPPITTFS